MTEEPQPSTGHEGPGRYMTEPGRPGPRRALPWAAPATASDPARAAMLELAVTIEPGTSGVDAELAEFGAIEALARFRNGRGPLRHAGSPPVLRSATCPAGVRIVLRGDDEYPTQLEDLDEPPLALWVRGPLDLRMAATRSVAVVGARASSAYGQRVAHQLGLELAGRDWAVVSGAAFGIDAAAHRGALGASGPTIAVLACGVDVPYPRAHETLIAAMGDEGAIITELPPGSAPLRYRFLARNRIIAALTRGCVVVEAAMRSGALSTANRAQELHRPLMAFPGPVDVVTSSGTNRLLRDGAAVLVRDCDDVVATILARSPEDPMGGTSLPPQAAAIAGALTSDPCPASALARQTGLDAALVTSILGLLEVSGLASRGPRGWTT